MIISHTAHQVLIILRFYPSRVLNINLINECISSSTNQFIFLGNFIPILIQQ